MADEKKKGPIIGIDLGTTKSVVSIYESDEPRVLENKLGKRITASYIALKKNKNGSTEWLIGDSAKNQAAMNPLNTLYGVKRLIGRRFDDPEVAKMKSLASYKIVEGPNGDAWVEIDGQPMAPAEVSAKVLRELKEAAEKYFGVEVTQAVITCPAYFNDSQRKATKDAGKIAGLDVLRVINEPTAAALAYGKDKKRSGRVAVFDLGGGTFDVSILDLAMEDGQNTFKVLSTKGDTFLGGENFDERIMDYLIEELKKEHGVDIKNPSATGAEKSANLKALQRIKDASEKAKIELSLQDMVNIDLQFLITNADGEVVNFDHTLTRNKLEQLVMDLIEKTKKPCEEALADAGLTIADIDEVLLVGAQTRMPKVVEYVTGLFGKAPRQDIAAQEIVAMGAAVQGAVLSGTVDDVLLVDVIPLSIGLGTKGDRFAKVVERNATIPAAKTEKFFVAEDDQEDISLMIYQGERDKASANKLLGKFIMELNPGIKKGTEVAVTLEVDANGAMSISAKVGGKTAQFKLESNGGLTEEDVKKMLKDAEENAEADRIYRERQIILATAPDMIQKAAQDVQKDWYVNGPEDLKQAFDENVKSLTEAVTLKNADQIVAAAEKLKESRSALGRAFTEAAEKAETVIPDDQQTSPDVPAPDKDTGTGGPDVPQI